MKSAKPGNRFDLLGLGLIMIISLFYMRQSLAQLEYLSQRRLANGNHTTVGYGDVMARDLPKANSFLAGGFFDDPHYVNEVNWYPFMTPYLVSIISRIISTQPYYSYLLTGIISSGLYIIALALFVRFHFGIISYIFYTILLSLGKSWPDNGYYPFQTAHIPFLIYLILAGALLNHIVNQKESSSGNATVYLSIGLGFINGVLGIWHGASFFTATFTSLFLMIGLFAAEINKRKLGSVVQLVFLFVFSLVIGISPLLLPQIIHYGHYQTADAARLSLDTVYEDGNLPEGLFFLKLLPTGVDAGFLIAFLLLFIVAKRSRQYKLAPLFISYAGAKALAHLGFVVNSTEYPWLAKLSQRILMAPPHTFNEISHHLLGIIKIVVFCASIELIIHGLRKAIPALKSRFFTSEILDLKLPIVALILSGLIFFAHHPLQPAFYISAIDQNIVLFASEVEKLVGPNETVIDANPLAGFSSIKILYTGSPQHSNPYVDKERAEAQYMINSGIIANMNEVIDRYNIHYAVVYSKQPSVVSKLCKKDTLLSSDNSEYQLISLTTCSPPN